jgi:xylan 1,4-beta-xylosidase
MQKRVESGLVLNAFARTTQRGALAALFAWTAAACSTGSGHASAIPTGGSTSVAVCKSGDSCSDPSVTCTDSNGVACSCVGPDGARYVTCDTGSAGGAGGAGGNDAGSGGRDGAGGTFVRPAAGGVSGYGQDTGQPCSDSAPYVSSGQPDYRLVVDASQSQGAWNRFYERAVAADHANTVLTSAYGRNIQEALKKGHDQAGFQYVRFHGILNYDINVYTEDAGVPVVDFGRFDEVYDAILTAGMHPIFEVSFTPLGLVSATDSADWILWYNWHKANISTPKDWTKWENLMATIVQHLEARYGVDEIRNNWYFEVWNEASWMYAAGMGGYGTLYQHTAKGLAAGDPSIRIGGPAESSAGSGTAITNLINVANSSGVKLDFITYHCYASDGQTIADPKYSRDFHATMVNTVNTAGFTGELMVTEWGPNSAAGVDRDTESSASFIAKTVHLIGTNDATPPPTAYAYWTISDIYEEIDTGTNTAYREGNYGLLLKGDPAIPASFDVSKPAFNAFRLLHWMGATRVSLTGGTTDDGVNGVATTSLDGSKLQILVYNHVAGGTADSSQSKLVTLTIDNLAAAGAYSIRHYVVDQTHSNSYTAWVQMGKPAKPTTDQWATLSDASELCYYDSVLTPSSNSITLTFPQKTLSVSLITLQPQ